MIALELTLDAAEIAELDAEESSPSFDVTAPCGTTASEVGP